MIPTQQLAVLGYLGLVVISAESIFVYGCIIRAGRNYQDNEKRKKARARFTKRWETMKTAASRETTEAAARQAVEGTAQRPGCAPWIRKRRPNTAALEAGDGEVAVPMPESQQRAPTARPPRQEQQQQQQRPPATEDDGDELATRRSSVVTFLPMGGVGDGGSSEDPSDFQAPESELSEYASDDANGGGGKGAAPPDWWGRTSSKHKAMWAEIRRNPDYALYVATRVDTWCFWLCTIIYIVAAAVILSINADYVSTF